MQKYYNEFVSKTNLRDFETKINEAYLQKGWRLTSIVDTLMDSQNVFVQAVFEKDDKNLSSEEMMDVIQKENLVKASENLMNPQTLGKMLASNPSLFNTLMQTN